MAKVVLAEAMGMCFGVRDALQAAKSISDPDAVTIHGELVHNPQVLVQLQARGFRQSSEQDRQSLPETTDVLVTAHGISNGERERLLQAGKHLIDTTCPLVRRAHHAAQTLAQQGCHVIVIGQPGHVEVQGIIEDLSSYDIVSKASDVPTWPQRSLGVICQTTTPPRIAAEVIAAIEERNRHAQVRFVNTICQPTMDRQIAVEMLCLQVDVLVVVGGENSNNTRQLVELVRECGVTAYRVSAARELRREWFEGHDPIGLTAGTSALDETIQEVQEWLGCLSRPEQPSVGSSFERMRHKSTS